MLLLIPAAGDGLGMNDQLSTAREPQVELNLQKFSAASECLVARGEAASQLVHNVVQRVRAAYATMALGLCERMLRMTAEYTSQREQFGVAVATFQAVGHRAADAYIDVECLRLVVQQAVSRLSLGLDADEAVTIAKIWTGDVCHRVSQAAQHLHGGIGVDRDYPLHRYCLWARQLELSLGTSAAMTEQLGDDIARAFKVESLEATA